MYCCLRMFSRSFSKKDTVSFPTSDFLVPVARIIGTEGRQGIIMVLKLPVAIMLNC